MKTHSGRSLAKGAAALAGFTLVEIMVVIVILGILATIVTTNVLGQSEKAQISTAEIEVQSILKQAELYMIQNPGSGVPEWEDLLKVDERGHAYIDGGEPKDDPWGNAYVLEPDVDYPNKPYVKSLGPDGIPDTEDDIDNKKLSRRKEH